ncbi:unnamed protein product [Pleuronectes platessa]|uniref:Uncharacterized protein n=1 Tax=Pleuronectes platessa TaxID=8262 RepID=A0A9N7UAF4_PLEPL|nr:unnamed protein product [Pleuronectes platessa]
MTNAVEKESYRCRLSSCCQTSGFGFQMRDRGGESRGEERTIIREDEYAQPTPGYRKNGLCSGNVRSNPFCSIIRPVDRGGSARWSGAGSLIARGGPRWPRVLVSPCLPGRSGGTQLLVTAAPASLLSVSAAQTK